MNVLVCGAGGFIGQTVALRLERCGHRVVRGLSKVASVDSARSAIAVDFSRDTYAGAWPPRLHGIDAVVNTVGVLRDSARRPMDRVHEAVPRALFDACATAGVRRVVHLSALGIERSATRYAVTKRAADRHLVALTEAGRLDGVAIRPSIVFGPAGASSRLFLTLARLPVLLLPDVVAAARVQPLLAVELAEAVEALLTRSPVAGIIELGGPRDLPLAGFIGTLRGQAGHAPARRIRLPATLAVLSARLGDAVPITPWGRETLSLLGEPNVTDPRTLRDLLGRDATPPDRFMSAERGLE